MSVHKTSSRPGVAKVFVSAEQFSWGTAIDYRGTQADLLAAGVAQSYMFEDISKSGQRTRSDEFGDNYMIQRRPKGIWELTLRRRPEPTYEDVTDASATKRKWYPEAKVNVDRIVAEILSRLQR